MGWLTGPRESTKQQIAIPDGSQGWLIIDSFGAARLNLAGVRAVKDPHRGGGCAARVRAGGCLHAQSVPAESGRVRPVPADRIAARVVVDSNGDSNRPGRERPAAARRGQSSEAANTDRRRRTVRTELVSEASRGREGRAAEARSSRLGRRAHPHR